MDIEFNDLKELRQRVEPALNTKLTELKSKNYNLITKDDIWNYLKQEKWQSAINLTLYDMVNDIMNMNECDIEAYVMEGSENYDESK